jgi:hypothetical protein
VKGGRRDDYGEELNGETGANVVPLQGGVGNRATSRSKYGTKKPKKAAAAV